MFNNHTNSPLFLGTSPARRDTITRIRPSPPLAPTLPAVVPVQRRVRKTEYDAPSDLKERAGRLGPDEQRIVRDYAGDTDATRTRVLEKFESHRQQNNNQAPIISRDSQRPNAGPNEVEWICTICSEAFPRFQKVAIHLTSKEWSLPSWPCPVKSCSHIRPYRALDQLRRHMRLKHPNVHLESATPSASTPSPQPQAVHLDAVLECQLFPFIESIDRPRQSARPLGSNYVEGSFGLTHKQRFSFERPPWDNLQPQTSTIFDLSPPSLPLPFSSQLIGNDARNSYQTSWPGTSTSPSTLAPRITNTARQFQLDRNVESFPAGKYTSPGNSTEAGVAPHWYNRPALSQTGSGSSSTSSSFDPSIGYQVPLQTHSRGYSTWENEMRRQPMIPSAFTSSEAGICRTKQKTGHGRLLGLYSRFLIIVQLKLWPLGG